MRQIVILSALLVAALGASYVTWTQPPEEKTLETTDIAVYTGGPDDVTKITWKSKKSTIAISRLHDARGDYVWIDGTETKEILVKPVVDPNAPKDLTDPNAPKDPAAPETPAAPDAPKDPAAPAAEPAKPAEPETTTEVKAVQFRGGAPADTLWTDWAPLLAMRELKLPADADPATFGLAEPAATITVERKGGTVEIQVGGETYGTKDRFVRVGEKVYLVADSKLRPLEFAATRLVERRLHPFEENQMDKVTIATPDGKSATFVHENKDDKAKAFWSREGAPGAEDSAGDTWLGKVFRLRASLYTDEKTLTGTPVPIFSVTVTDGKEPWKYEILRVGEGDTADYYARSEYDRALVTLTRSLANDAIADLATVFTAE